MSTSLLPDDSYNRSIGNTTPSPQRKKKGRSPNQAALAANLKRRGATAVQSSMRSSGAYDDDATINSFINQANPGTGSLDAPAPAYDSMTQAGRTGQGGGHDSALEQQRGRDMAAAAMAGGGHEFPALEMDPARRQQQYMERLTAHRLGLDLSNPDHAREFNELKWLTSQKRKQVGFYTGADYRADYAAGLR